MTIDVGNPLPKLVERIGQEAAMTFHDDCPTCGSHGLVPMLQCDYDPDGCLWLVSCESCQAQDHVVRA